LVLHGADCGDCGTLDGAAPPGMRGAGDLLSAIADQNGRAISDADADGDGRIIGHRRVGLRPWSGQILPAFRERDVCSVHLTKQQNTIEVNAHAACNGLPFVARVAEFDVSDREQVISDVGEGAAPKHRAPLGLRPLETTARLGLNHDDPRIGH